MLRIGAALSTLLLGTVSAAATDLTVTFIGHASVHVSDGKRAVLVDFPYDSGAEFTPWSAGGA
jgi:L-ascorbate metabolism protein UlaG (beta-lactamase superfamily)